MPWAAASLRSACSLQYISYPSLAQFHRNAVYTLAARAALCLRLPLTLRSGEPEAWLQGCVCEQGSRHRLPRTMHISLCLRLLDFYVS